jgi:FixJ family two-component response regulator
LSLREREVFVLVVRGLPSKQIADVIGVSKRTLKAHRSEVMHKMGVQSGAELARVVEWLSDFFQIKPASSATKG